MGKETKYKIKSCKMCPASSEVCYLYNFCSTKCNDTKLKIEKLVNKYYKKGKGENNG